MPVRFDTFRVSGGVVAMLAIFVMFTYCQNSHARKDVKVSVKVDITNVIGPVNRGILGNNIIGYRDGRIAGQFNRYGGGVWDPEKGVPSKEYIELMKKAGISSLRWPGGRWRKSMDWKTKVVGDNRQPFGLPEFLMLCELVGAEPVITFSANNEWDIDIEGLVAYLNQPLAGVGVKNAKRNQWAKQRAQDGRKEPWGVKWFEYGNENFNSALSVEDYVSGYKRARLVIKEISPYAQLGAVLEDSDNVSSGWTFGVLEGLGESLDYGIIHPYLPMVGKGVIEKIGLEQTLTASLYADANLEYRLRRYSEIATELGRKQPLRLAATEYNAHFTQEKPVPIRHTLSTAIHNADFVRVLLQPKYNIMFANYWHLANSYWGMLTGTPAKGEKIGKRPNYYVYKIFNESLLDDLIGLDITPVIREFKGSVGIGPRLMNKKVKARKPVEINVPGKWTRQYFSDGRQSQDNGILKVEFLGEKEVDYYHGSKLVPVNPNTLYRISVQIRTNALRQGKAGIAVGDAMGWSKTHYQAKNTSLTGTTSWQWVTIDYRTLAKAKKIQVIARKYRGNGATKGVAEFGKVKVQELPGVLPVGTAVTGMATVSRDRDKLALILINKDLKETIQATLPLPEGYFPVSGQVLKGDSPLGLTETDFQISDISFTMRGKVVAREVVVDLAPHSLSALTLSRNNRSTQ